MKNILILEDNLAQQQAMLQIVKEVSDDVNIYTAGSIEEASVIILWNHIDIFIVDIILYPKKNGDVSGLQFVKKLRETEEYAFAPVIFTTSLEDPELYAYKKLKCIEYIEKPYEPAQVREVVTRCMGFPGTKPKVKEQIVFREDGILWPVNVEDIRYIETSHHVIYVHRMDGEVNKFSYRTVKEILDDTEEVTLVQCSRNTLINRAHVRNIDIVNGFVELEGEDKKIDIGATFKKKMKEIFKLG